MNLANTAINMATSHIGYILFIVALGGIVLTSISAYRCDINKTPYPKTHMAILVSSFVVLVVVLSIP